MWTFRNAFPVKYEAPELDAEANEVAIETITLTFDSMDIE